MAYINLKNAGAHQSTSSTYVSGTGTAGTANTAMTVLTRTLKANVLTQVGDRLRIRCYFFANSAAPIIGTVKLGPAASEVTVANITHSGGALSALVECWLHYIDSTHCNIIEQEVGALGSLTAVNVAGFTWNAQQNIIFTQNQVGGNFTTVYGLFVDYLPLGVI
jgi:hypothetical protein